MEQNNNNNNNNLLQLICYSVAVVILKCKQNMKLVTTKFKSGGLHEKYVVATWNLGNRLSICLPMVHTLLVLYTCQQQSVIRVTLKFIATTVNTRLVS